MYIVQRTRYKVHSTLYKVQDTSNQVGSVSGYYVYILYLVFSQYKGSATWYIVLVQGIALLVQDTMYDVLSTMERHDST